MFQPISRALCCLFILQWGLLPYVSRTCVDILTFLKVIINVNVELSSRRHLYSVTQLKGWSLSSLSVTDLSYDSHYNYYLHWHFIISVKEVIIIIITEMIFMVLSSWHSHCESWPGLFDECRLSAEVATNPQTKPTDLDCESARKKWQLPSTFTIAILLLLSRSPTEGGRLSRPRHCSKGVQPMPKAVYRSGVMINTTAK